MELQIYFVFYSLKTVYNIIINKWFLINIKYYVQSTGESCSRDWSAKRDG